MLSKVIPIALLLLVLIEAQLLRVDTKVVDPEKCSRKHNIYAVDHSSSMNWYGSWGRALIFLAGQNTLPAKFKSLFRFSRWGVPPQPIQNYYTHSFDPTLPPPMPVPDGGAHYDDALHQASEILSYGYPQTTCLYLISDGWQNCSQAALDEWNNTVRSFVKSTGCPVSVKCVYTEKPKDQWGTPWMEPLCKELNAQIYQLQKDISPDVLDPKNALGKAIQSGPPIDIEPVRRPDSNQNCLAHHT